MHKLVLVMWLSEEEALVFVVLECFLLAVNFIAMQLPALVRPPCDEADLRLSPKRK